MKIIVIGAGLAGLIFANACQRFGITVKVYEKKSSLANIGGGLILWPYGLQLLQALGMQDVVEPYAVTVKGNHIVGQQGSVLLRENYATLYALLGGSFLPIERSLLQQTLFSRLPINTVTFNASSFYIEQDAHQARIFFEDGHSDSADLIIGADGIHSVVRQQFNAVPLQYSTVCWWGGIVEQKNISFLNPEEVFIALGLGKNCIVWPLANNRMMWYLPVKLPAEQLIREGDGMAQLQSICSDWLPEVNAIIRAPVLSRGFHLPVYVLPTQSPWSQSRVTLIGDAAHALGPLLSQGVNQAIEDVYVLLHCLQDHGESLTGRLQRYESLRRARVQALGLIENQTIATMINEDSAHLQALETEIKQLQPGNAYHDILPLVDKNTCAKIIDLARLVTV